MRPAVITHDKALSYRDSDSPRAEYVTYEVAAIASIRSTRRPASSSKFSKTVNVFPRFRSISCSGMEGEGEFGTRALQGTMASMWWMFDISKSARPSALEKLSAFSRHTMRGSR